MWSKTYLYFVKKLEEIIMFDDIDFKSAVSNSRGAASGSPVSITHNKGEKKEEQTYKISK